MNSPQRALSSVQRLCGSRAYLCKTPDNLYVSTWHISLYISNIDCG